MANLYYLQQTCPILIRSTLTLSQNEHITFSSRMAPPPLSFKVEARCSTTKARLSTISLPHNTFQTPIFMHVGTQGTIKGVTTQQLNDLGVPIILGNTYHLGHRPGPDIMGEAGGLHQFMNWDKAILTDSGGFQMVSLLKLAEFTEQGVKFQSPHNGSEMLLTPEHSMAIQNALGSDVMMQLDDVVSVLTEGERMKDAMDRSIRWLDRCQTAHKREHDQNLFGIIQGGLNPTWRKECLEKMIERDCPGYAIGGLSGGEEKADFWKTVSLCTDHLPPNKPRYLMGVGYQVELVVCSALGCDMYDCVFPTRTARFGSALVRTGQLQLKNTQYVTDTQPIDKDCTCMTCKEYTRAYLHCLLQEDTTGVILLTIHNIAFQLRLMSDIREAVREDRFPEFIKEYFVRMFPKKNYPEWAVDALASVGVTLPTAIILCQSF
eukprot:sb/3464855/